MKKGFFRREQLAQVVITGSRASTAIQTWNEARGAGVGLLHVTCSLRFDHAPLGLTTLLSRADFWATGSLQSPYPAQLRPRKSSTALAMAGMFFRYGSGSRLSKPATP